MLRPAPSSLSLLLLAGPALAQDGTLAGTVRTTDGAAAAPARPHLAAPAGRAHRS